MSTAKFSPEVQSSLTRRSFISRAASGTVIAAMGGGMFYALSDRLTREARAMSLDDGRPRLPPGQRPFELDWGGLLAQPQAELDLDVHCVTGWSLLGALWRGVRIKDLAATAGLKPGTRHVVFEAAHGYTANILLHEALDPNALVAHRFDGKPLARPHGAPVRAVIPSLYFWKSAKWLTGIKFVARDEPGYWETRGYHNHADPWLEERYG